MESSKNVVFTLRDNNECNKQLWCFIQNYQLCKLFAFRLMFSSDGVKSSFSDGSKIIEKTQKLYTQLFLLLDQLKRGASFLKNGHEAITYFYPSFRSNGSSLAKPLPNAVQSVLFFRV